MSTKPKSAAVIARDAKKRKSLAGWREVGTSEAAGAACGMSRRAVNNWFRDDPEYREAARAAIEEYAATAGQEAHNALREHVRAATAGEMVLVRRGVEGGKPTEVYERVQLNPALVRLILTRADPRFTHPKTEVEHSGELSVWQMLQQQDEQKGQNGPTGSGGGPGRP